MSQFADRIGNSMEAAGIRALTLAALDLQGAAQRDAPIEEGTLRGSATSSIELTPTGAIAVVAFPMPYAAVQETHDEYLHPRGGKSHYLGDQVKARAPRYRMLLEREVRKAIRTRRGG